MAAPAVSRVHVTGAAAELLRRVTAEHGSLMFHQFGRLLRWVIADVLPTGRVHYRGLRRPPRRPQHRRHVPDVPVWMTKSQFEYSKATHLWCRVLFGGTGGRPLPDPFPDLHRRRTPLPGEAGREGPIGGCGPKPPHIRGRFRLWACRRAFSWRRRPCIDGGGVFRLPGDSQAGAGAGTRTAAQGAGPHIRVVVRLAGVLTW